MEKALEEIFCKEGKFLDNKDNEIKPIQIEGAIILEGINPSRINLAIENKFNKLKDKNNIYREVNAYLIGEIEDQVQAIMPFGRRHKNLAVNFYKI